MPNDAIQYIPPVYRPPSEAELLILPVTNGCSWNKCTFCEMYTAPQKRFRPRSEEEVLESIRRCGEELGGEVRRIFLADGDAMTLSTRRLVTVLEAIKRELPSVHRISSYCLPRNLRKKSVEEIKELAALGLSLVYVGAELGDDEVLAKVNKGETFATTLEALEKLGEAGIKRSVMILNGLGGQALSKQHAMNSAALMNAAQPEFVATLVVSFPQGEERLRADFHGRPSPNAIPASTRCSKRCGPISARTTSEKPRPAYWRRCGCGPKRPRRTTSRRRCSCGAARCAALLRNSARRCGGMRRFCRRAWSWCGTRLPHGLRISRWRHWRALQSSSELLQPCWLRAAGCFWRWGSGSASAPRPGRRRARQETTRIAEAVGWLEKGDPRGGPDRRGGTGGQSGRFAGPAGGGAQRVATGGVEAAIREVQRYAASGPFAGELLLAAGRAPAALAALRAAAPAGLPARVPDGHGPGGTAQRAGRASREAPGGPAGRERGDRRPFPAGRRAAQQAKYGPAAECYRKVLEGDAQFVPALHNLAYLLAEHLGQSEEALNLAQKARELAPESASTDDVLGLVLYRRGIGSLAEIHLKEAAANGCARASAHLALMRARRESSQSASNTLPDPVALGWVDLGAAENAEARLETYRRTRGCQPDETALDAVLRERSPARFTERIIPAMMVCEPQPAFNPASLPSPQAVTLENLRALWSNPDLMLQRLFGLSGVNAADAPGWDNTFISWDDTRSLPPKITKAPERIGDPVFRNPATPQDAAGWKCTTRCGRALFTGSKVGRKSQKLPRRPGNGCAGRRTGLAD